MDALFSDYEDARKSGLFDPDYYLATYPDVADRNVDPLVHYLEEGAREGRNPHPDFDGAFYLEQCRAKGEQPENPLLHYIRIGSARGFKTRPAVGAGRSRPARPRQENTDALGRAPILVAIESLGVVGGPDGSSRLSVGGWALAAAPIAEISVSLDDAVVGTANYGLPRPDIARLYPDRPGAAQCGFLLAFTIPDLKGSSIEPLLSVRTADGEVGHRPLQVKVPPQEVGLRVVDPLDDAADAGPAAAPPMQLYIDDATVDASGILRIEGWVICLVQIESVECFIDELRLGKAEFGRVRDDVATTHPDYPNARFSGFTLATDVGQHRPGRATIQVTATARTGISRSATTQVEIPAQVRARRTAPARAARFQYHCDDLTLTMAGTLALRGWVVCPSPAEAIVIQLDGKEIGRAAIGLERPEIGNLYPTLPHARRGGFSFEAELEAAAVAGEHLVTLVVRREDGETDEATIPVTANEMRMPRDSAAPGELQLHIDSPRLIDGAVDAPIRGNLEISGWALAKAGVAAIQVDIDGKPLVVADYGLRRLDIRAAFPDWEGALTSGYQALVPRRLLPKGNAVIRVTLRDTAGKVAATEFRIAVEELSEVPGPWSLRRRMVQAEIDLGLRILDRCGHRPSFVVVLPLGRGADWLRKARVTIASLAAQVYGDWRLLLPTSNGGDGAALRDRLLAEIEIPAGRVELLRNVTPAGLAAMASAGGRSARETFCAVLSAGDELGVDAFLEMALASALDRDAEFLYSDERRRNPGSGAVEAFFKPQWSPDLLLSTNYIGRLWCARADLWGAVADPTGGLLAAGEYDLVLRCTEAATAIRHVPAVLCERAVDGAEQPEQSREALERSLARRGTVGEVRPGLGEGTYRIKRALTRPGLVSIIIPTCAGQGMIATCIDKLRSLTAYRNFEIVCIENIAPKDRKWRTWLRRNADRVTSTTEPFNWARFSNQAAALARGEYLLFLNDDIEVIDPDWLDMLVEQAQRPEVGVVGARLIYPDRRIQHAGMFLAAVGQARHAFRYAPEDAPGYFGLALTQRNVIAVTGACLFTRRDTYDALGGFDETQAVVNNDVDFCLRARRRGLLTVYAPQVKLIHHEAISRAALEDDYDAAVFDSKWRDLFLAGDPYFSPHLSKAHDDFAIDHEPTRLLVTGRPVLSRGEIRKILVVKLDHIGDCVIAFPAVRRLKQHFPDARISVLTSRASRPVWSLEPSVEQTLEFDFFHARSGLGEIERSEEDWRELAARLTPLRFDLAVDLRKHTETRPALQHTGARYLAGFDWRNQFPWLDIALEWTGDQMYARKRQHNGDDLINLVDAIAAACEGDRAVIGARPALTATVAAVTGEHDAAGPLVCVHPTVGNDARQWPLRYFAAVIDRLVEEDGARVVLIGGPGDEEMAAELLGHVRQPQSVASLVGQLPLSELPALLAEAALFLGNNSGPKHIAAGLGVPTVGIHSGTEDVREWGPIGPGALAVAREVVCAPCYLAHAEDCRRGLVCLRQLEPARVYEACKRLLLLGPPGRLLSRPAEDARPRGWRSGRPARTGGPANGAKLRPAAQ